MVFNGKMNPGHQPQHLLLPGHRPDTDMAQPRHGLCSSKVWDFTMASRARLATHNRVFLSTLTSPVPSLFLMLKLIWLFLCPIYPLHVAANRSLGI